ncbi:MAG: four helix bundle protein [Candidatus Omnitrophota bacterium]
MEKNRFSFEDLEVWQKSIDLARTILAITESLSNRGKHFRLIEQLESASTSIALNIAEGKGRYSKKEFIHFLYIARGSLFETISLLIILSKNNMITDSQLEELRNRASEAGKMISGLINSIK